MHQNAKANCIRAIESGKKLLISDLYSQSPAKIPIERKSVAQYVVDRFSEAEGFHFVFHAEYEISQQPRAYPSAFAKARIFNFRCSQRWRVRPESDSTIPYGRTRNRRVRKKKFQCEGSISVIFPTS